MTDRPQEMAMDNINPCPRCGALPCDWVDNPHAALTQPTPSLQPDPGANESQGDVVVTGEDIPALASRLGALAAREMSNLSFDVEGVSKAASCLRQQAAEVEALRGEVNKFKEAQRQWEFNLASLQEQWCEQQARATKAEADNARLREALGKIARNEIEVFDEGLNETVLVSMSAEEMADIAYQAREVQGA